MAAGRKNAEKRTAAKKPHSAQKPNAALLNRQQFSGELRYQICSVLIITMRNNEMLTNSEYSWFRRFCLSKYRPLLGSLFAAAADKELAAAEMLNYVAAPSLSQLS